MTLRALLRDPLVHFLLIAVALFGIYELMRDDSNDAGDQTIVVDREALLTFIQYRSKAFEPQLSERRLQSLSPVELELLIDDYVREEVLHREALRLGLDGDDYVIRRRLVQKLEFITRGFAEAGTDPSEETVRAYFDEHRADYFVEPHLTFTHVFFDAERHGGPEARQLAEAKLLELNVAPVPFDRAPQHGDRFLYHLNYVERTLGYVASHFGPDMAQALYALEPDDQSWRGPFESTYGAHLVMLTAKQEGREPVLEEIRGRVAEDVTREAIRATTDEAVDALIATYDVRIAYEGDGDAADSASSR